MIKILHITEAFGGGVTSAINTYVEHADQFEHHLFASVRDGDVTGEEGAGKFKSVSLVPRQLSSVFLLYRLIGSLSPEVIHVHSTYAGFLVRLMPFVSKTKIVYTPHAFAFLRSESRWKLALYYFIECMLSIRTQVIAGCGKHERDIANQFKDKSHTTELINVAGQLPMIEPISKPIPVVSMVGRVCEQKGYQFFADAAIQSGNDVKFLWIGGGDKFGVEVLQHSGVQVTGWVSRDEVLNHLANSDLYFHSSAWDGFPISVLEAVNYNLPLLLRSIGPFTAENLVVIDSPGEAAQKIKNFFETDYKNNSDLHFNRDRVRNYHTSKNLTLALTELYSRFEPRA